MRLTSLITVLFCCGLGLATEPSLPERQLTLQEILAGMDRMDKARTESLRAYTSLRRYTLENKRFKTTAEMRVEMTYAHPGTKSFKVLSEKGSSLIRKRVLRRLMATELEAVRPDVRDSTQISPANYTFRLVGRETEDTRRYYVLEAEPKRPSKLLFRGRIWVDAEDFAVVRIQGSPAQNASLIIQKTTFVHQYRKFDRFWLPVSNSSQTDVRVFGRTVVKVEYTDYLINQELSSNGPGPKPASEETGSK